MAAPGELPGPSGALGSGPDSAQPHARQQQTAQPPALPPPPPVPPPPTAHYKRSTNKLWRAGAGPAQPAAARATGPTTAKLAAAPARRGNHVWTRQQQATAPPPVPCSKPWQRQQQASGPTAGLPVTRSAVKQQQRQPPVQASASKVWTREQQQPTAPAAGLPRTNRVWTRQQQGQQPASTQPSAAQTAKTAQRAVAAPQLGTAGAAAGARPANKALKWVRAQQPAGSPAAPAQQPLQANAATPAKLHVSKAAQRLLVYKQAGRKGTSLRRTAVKAAAGGSLTWRNPAGQAALPLPTRSAATPAARKPLGRVSPSTLLKGVPRRIASSSKPQRRKFVWTAAAAAAGPAAKDEGPSTAASGRPVQASSSGGIQAGNRLLRLGSCLYKAIGKRNGRSLSLQRQSSGSQLAAAAAAALASRGAASPGQAAALPSSRAAVATQAAGAVQTRRIGRYKLVSVAALAQAAVLKRRSPALKPGKAAAGLAAAALKVRGGVVKTRSPGASAALRQQQQRRQARSAGSGAKIVYCPLYCRTGKCERRGKGCPYKHDSTKRAVCTRWLRGRCELGTQCSLQHQRKAELMPVCQHFLLGRCTAEACPYLHVKRPVDAPVCKRFLRGFCPAGAACPHKHYTLRMVREEKTFRAAAAASGGKKAAGRGGGGKKKGGKRYFEETIAVPEQPAIKRARASPGPAAPAAEADDLFASLGDFVPL